MLRGAEFQLLVLLAGPILLVLTVIFGRLGKAKMYNICFGLMVSSVLYLWGLSCLIIPVAIFFVARAFGKNRTRQLSKRAAVGMIAIGVFSLMGSCVGWMLFQNAAKLVAK